MCSNYSTLMSHTVVEARLRKAAMISEQQYDSCQERTQIWYWECWWRSIKKVELNGLVLTVSTVFFTASLNHSGPHSFTQSYGHVQSRDRGRCCRLWWWFCGFKPETRRKHCTESALQGAQSSPLTTGAASKVQFRSSESDGSKEWLGRGAGEEVVDCCSDQRGDENL